MASLIAGLWQTVVSSKEEMVSLVELPTAPAPATTGTGTGYAMKHAESMGTIRPSRPCRTCVAHPEVQGWCTHNYLPLVARGFARIRRREPCLEIADLGRKCSVRPDTHVSGLFKDKLYRNTPSVLPQTSKRQSQSLPPSLLLKG